MNKLSALLLIAVLFACQKEKDPRISTIDSFLTGQVEHFKFNGNVLVAERGKIIYKKSFGFSNFDTQESLNDSSVFELASVSKQFTATAILLLKERGKLQLTDSLRHFFPELPYHNITVYQLLTHTSGVPDYESNMESKWDHRKIAFNGDMINFLAKEKTPIDFLPGKKWQYSNTGYALLASIIEKVSGQSYKDFLAANIFTPLGMTHSRVYNTRRSGETLKNYAYGYVWSDSLKKYQLPDSVKAFNMVYWLDGIQGDGVVNSTVGDLLKWDRGMVNHTILSEASVKEMVSQQALIDSTSKNYYGYGVMVGKNKSGNFITHSGGWPGYVTNLARYTDDDKTIIILSNNQSASPAISETIVRILNNESLVSAYEHKPVSLDTTALKPFVGSYVTSNAAFDLAIGKEGVELILKSGARRKLIPESATKLYYADGRDLQLEIEKDADGQPKFYRIAYGIKEEIKKVK
ncbi:MAG: beta-lactamase family protein [Bacteroidetes bacterium]|nr:beta-lactamase family protein [Bacteroidota bacterium]